MAELLFATGSVEIHAAAEGGKAPRVSIVAYGGGLMNVPGFGAAAIDLQGLEASEAVPLLVDHIASLEGVIGSGRATKQGGKLLVEGSLVLANEAARKIVELAKGGVPLQASVGVEPIERQFIRGGESVAINGRTLRAQGDGFRLVRRGKLREISIVAIGADGSTSVAVAASQAKGRTMAKDSPNSATELDTFEPTGAERVYARWKEAKFHSPNIREQMEPVMLKAASGAVSFDDFEREMLKAEKRDLELHVLRASRPQSPSVQAENPGPGSPAVLQAAFLRHMGQEALAEKMLGAEAIQRAVDLRATHVLDLFKAALTLARREVPASRDEMIRAAFSTTSLPGILGDAANKMTLGAYQAFPSIARVVARLLSANDFKDHTGYRLTGDAKLLELPPDGEIKHGTLAESSFSYNVATYARMFGLNRQQIINDDLGALAEVPRIIGRASAALIEELFWKLVLANTGNFFHADNGNYVSGAGTVLGLAGLGLGVSAIRKQTDPQGQPIQVQPKYLVVPPELETTADQLYASSNIALIQPDTGPTDATSVPDGNPYKGKYQPQVVPHLSNSTYAGYSAAAWYLFGDPADVAAFGLAYLNGKQAPTIEMQDADFNKLGVQYRGYIDVGVCQADQRGALKSKGAA